ncbi:hypothetical protein Q0V21_19400 [Paenibacillus sp. 11B]|uniref:hypothetical protein n=1 Tax=Paenibacillus sp. 11B TaxID=3060965 RepID=UPI0026547C25|nr:hypothetical protein [Paenibacillus sp. 11B]MDN8590928.1 hypothetical protein [Paenibacillus sp. 11B]
MRELTIGNQTVRVRATALALLFYKKEFKTDLLGDMMKMVGGDSDGGEVDPTNIDMLSNLQMVWAMAKADSYGKEFPSFEPWLASLGDDLDLSDPAFLVAALEEATDGFFRKNNGVKGGVAT